MNDPCQLCGNTGLVVVPHPKCVYAGQLAYYPQTMRIYTGAVVCMDCPIGRVQNDRERLREKPRANFRTYTMWLNGLDGVALLAEHERRAADLARTGQAPKQESFETLPTT